MYSIQVITYRLLNIQSHLMQQAMNALQVMDRYWKEVIQVST